MKNELFQQGSITHYKKFDFCNVNTHMSAFEFHLEKLRLSTMQSGKLHLHISLRLLKLMYLINESLLQKLYTKI